MSLTNLQCIRTVCATIFLMTANAVFGQQPTSVNIAYDNDHPAQCLDVYLAKSEKPTPVIVYIHGGGWRAGSKQHVPRWLRKFVTDGEVSVVSVEYRFTDVATHPAQVNDCLRAIQFVRHNANAWNIDATRLGVTGGSAGGHLSAYVALCDDARNSDSEDKVEQQSSRVTCCVSFAGPTDWTLLSSIDHNHPAYRQLIGFPPKTSAEDLDADLVKSVSPISFVTKNDPPIMQVHGDKDTSVPIQHARALHDRLQAADVTSELVVIEGGSHAVAGASDAVSRRAVGFMKQYLLSQ